MLHVLEYIVGGGLGLVDRWRVDSGDAVLVGVSFVRVQNAGSETRAAVGWRGGEEDFFDAPNLADVGADVEREGEGPGRHDEIGRLYRIVDKGNFICELRPWSKNSRSNLAVYNEVIC